jgi:C4-dicarboxylate-specific signal transduction histidine kinase
MNDVVHHRLREEGLALFGRVGADVSHEMRNTLSIIGEYAGLLNDLLVMAENGSTPDYAKLKGLPVKIANQIHRGTETMERLSRFAHAADEQAESCDLTAIVGNVVALAQRRVAMAGCKLELQLPDQMVPVAANPFTLQQAVFCAIELMLEFQEKGEVDTIKVLAEPPKAVITISGNANVAGDKLTAQVSRLTAVMRELEGTIGTSWTEGVLSLVLTVPIQ